MQLTDEELYFIWLLWLATDKQFREAETYLDIVLEATDKVPVTAWPVWAVDNATEVIEDWYWTPNERDLIIEEHVELYDLTVKLFKVYDTH